MQLSEQVAFDLRALYSRYGYTQYKMSKFEEYDLYARNKDFLISENVITFTDLSGKLMALKPDVTLSIVKNSADQTPWVQKLYYNENVYRTAKAGAGFREIQQMGLETLGDLDDYCISEVLELACRSLLTISPAAVLDVSHLGLLQQVMDFAGIPKDLQADAAKIIGRKSTHELDQLCRNCDADAATLTALVSLSGKPTAVLPRLTVLLEGKADADTLTRFAAVIGTLEAQGLGDVLNIDFSVVDDMHYYNGFVCKGFVRGLPDSVLSGGQYDKLMKKMHRQSGAMGFAVYLDQLEYLAQPQSDYDVDIVILYDGPSAATAAKKAAALRADDKCVLVQKALPQNLRYRELLDLR